MHLGFPKTSQHEANHRQVDHGFAGQGLAFVVSTQSARTPEPTESTLHDPASRQHFEGVQVGALHNFDAATLPLGRQTHQLSHITSIGPDVFDFSASPLAEECGQQWLGPIAVLDVGRQDHHLEEQADGVDQDMPLASVDFLARVVAPLVAGFGTLHALAVDDGRAGLGFASLYPAQVFPQMGVNLLPQTIVLPQPEVMVGGAPRSEVLRQIAPLTASLDDIENPVDQFAEGVLAWPSRLGVFGKTVMDEVPFGVR